MRFVSLCTVLGAALLPVASAGPCKPKTTSVVSTTLAGSETISSAIETLSIDTETDLPSTFTSDATSFLETTLTDTATTDLTFETTVTETAATETAVETTATTDLSSVTESSMRFYNSSSSIIFVTQPGLTQPSFTLDISTSVTDFRLTSPLSWWTPDPESLSTDALSTDVSGTPEELPSTFEPFTTTTATTTTADSQITSVTSSGTDSTASSLVGSSTTSGSSYSLETDTSTLSDLPLDTSSSFDSSSTLLSTADTSIFTTTALDTTTSTTTSSEPTETRACPEGLSDPLTLFNGEKPSDNGVESLVLPFQVPLYGETSDMVYVSPNGLVTLRDSFGADAVPFLAFLPDENIESLAIFPHWIDMIVPEGSGAEVTYQVQETPNQPGVLTIDWCVFTTSDETAPNHFQMVISENPQRPITFFYYTIQPGGTLATIGAQNRDADQWVQYYGAVPDRTFMEVDTVVGDIRTGRF
ncbi:hypothetical protein NW768_011120 [Fusarium equiseti]|uniref:Uncharacterized protein n=1 Tax=Fusarium equiseti TaxID=61235 RepID=A0ABQ8QYG7_FUSEQ|nr:hypothetical protein NW768_011120 [Fusarium equiseti]